AGDDIRPLLLSGGYVNVNARPDREAAERLAEQASLRQREREWQDAIGHALLDKPFQQAGARLVFERQFERIGGALAGIPQGAIVEVGCGRGQLLEHLRQSSMGADRLLLGVDISVAVRALAERGQIGVRADAEQLPLRSGSAAAVVFNGSLHHAVDYRKSLREALRVLVPGGRLVVFEPASSVFSRVVHRVLDPFVFRFACEYESPVDRHLKHAFREEAVLEEIRASGATVERQASDFLAYPFTGCYATNRLGNSVRLMRALLRVERFIETLPGLRMAARTCAWRFLLVATKPGALERAAAVDKTGLPRSRSQRSSRLLRDAGLLSLLVCPRCQSSLREVESERVLACGACQLGYPVENTVPFLMEDPSRVRQLALRASFSEPAYVHGS
ncbi:MAG TPA: methyltransferase domain-containing protein, partial [Polyangiaceae bacterium]|nr:methyltransferase domain-containing protein [Polyangiaceae bacterium]